jgi:Aminopeptidase N
VVRQAVGWQNYHEQWLSEGFAQYFAALYAQHQRGPEGFASVLRQLRKWAMEASEQGPVYLGYRLGHIRNESRIFRALVYNKGAAVLHMLRLMVGDDAFFRGIRRFYRQERFRKAGTEDLRAAMEAESGQQLGRFFEQWIYGSGLPRLKVSYRVEGGDIVLRRGPAWRRVRRAGRADARLRREADDHHRPRLPGPPWSAASS